jgi:hypothetical protein
MLRIAGYVAVLAWAAFALYYAFDFRAMYAPYGDTGGDVFSTGMIAASLTSVRSFFGAFSWQPWADYPAFVYLSMGPFVAAVPLQWILHDPFKAVKLVYVLQLTIAFWATAALYARLFGSSTWRWFAAAIYVAIPLVTLQTRLMGFGWVAALIPVALFVNLQLAQRFGVRAAPAIGIVCSIASAAFTVEYAIFVGLPLVFLSLAINHWKGARVGLATMVAALVAFAIFPSYTVLVTLFGPRLMDWIDPKQAVPTQLDLFSQTAVNQIAGILKEATISGDPAFNASSSLPYALLGGAIAWSFALSALAIGLLRGRWRRWWPVIAVALALGILSFGPTIPVVGPALWNLIAKLPLLREVRTPDRFAQINALLVALGAAFGARLLARRKLWRTVAAAALATVSVGSYLAFDSGAHVLALQAVQERLPAYDHVTRTVARIGGRTAIDGFPLHGSQYDWAPYAPTAARVVFGWDLTGRYGRGDGGVALMRRAAVRTIVTTPNWSRDGEAGLPPDMADLVVRSGFATRTGDYDQGVNVFDLHARPMVSSVRPLCAFAGPDAFEIAAGLRFFEPDALVHDTIDSGCAQSLFADYDPLDAAIPKVAVAAWSGIGALGASEPLPGPNAFEIDRFGIAAPWYRNAYRGDSLVQNAPFLTFGYQGSTLTFSIARRGSYAIYARTSGLATLRTSDGRGKQVVAESRRVEGFAWVKLDLGELRPGGYALPFEITAAHESDIPAVVDMVAIAPSAPPGIGVKPSLVLNSMRTFEPPLAVRSYQYVFPRPSAEGITAKTQSVALSPGTEIGLVGGEARISAKGKIGHARFYWTGATGRYVVVAAGWFSELAPTMTLRAGGGALQIRYDPSIGIAPSTGYARMLLVHGAPIDVALDARPGGVASLTQITAMPVQREETPTTYDDSSETWQYAKNIPMEFFEAIHSDDVALAAGAIRAFPGATAEIPFRPVFAGGRITAAVQVSGGKGTAILRCGDREDRGALGNGSENPGGAALAVERPNSVPCALRVEWNSETLTIESVVIHARGTILANWSAKQYFGRGTYTWNAEATPGIQLAVDDRPWRLGTVHSLDAGWHTLTLVRAPGGMAPIVFRRVEAPTAPLPASVVDERSATNWHVTVPAATTLELAQFDDGNWFARTAAQTAFGYPCDLVNTCFDVPAATVDVGRRLSPLMALALWLTALDVVVALLVLFWPQLADLWQRRSRLVSPQAESR